MTSKSELESLHRLFFKVAKGLLQKDGYLSPLVVVGAGTKAFVYSLPQDKETWFIFVMTLLRTHGAGSYFIVGEAWAVAMERLIESLPPSENPARTEILFVYGCSRYGSKIARYQQFVRDPDGIRYVGPVDVCSNWEFRRMMPENW
ncbi:MAG: hypothetical protein ABSG74_02635 [Candidatus Bathyarchaeia archaeon]|jgi:hypothetical protein